MKTNVTKKEIESALKYCEENKLEVFTLEVIRNPIGNILLISENFDSEQTDISDYDIF